MSDELAKKLKVYLLVSSSIIFFGGLTIWLVLLSQGKRVTSDGRIEDTNVLKINVTPKDKVDVFINSKEVKLTDNRVTGVDVGEINVRLEKQDYTSWEKNVEVDKKEVKTIYAQLYPLNPEIEKVTDVNIDKIYFNEKKDNIIFTVLNGSEEEIGLWKYNYEKKPTDLFSDPKPEKFRNLTDSEINCLANNDYSINVSYNTDKILLSCEARLNIDSLRRR
ncbi:MAG: PEGA domain-containing protein [Candidatus Dojkabacteria bacterium]|nr:PEGA domain-containing protein [Candidatus Dojkabacteria bacterium]